jgi:hypothetical protein
MAGQHEVIEHLETGGHCELPRATGVSHFRRARDELKQFITQHGIALAPPDDLEGPCWFQVSSRLEEAIDEAIEDRIPIELAAFTSVRLRALRSLAESVSAQMDARHSSMRIAESHRLRLDRALGSIPGALRSMVVERPHAPRQLQGRVVDLVAGLNAFVRPGKAYRGPLWLEDSFEQLTVKAQARLATARRLVGAHGAHWEQRVEEGALRLIRETSEVLDSFAAIAPSP